MRVMPAILIVDDHADTRETVAYFLGINGYKPLVSSKLDDALGIVVSQSPAVVLLDLSIGGMSIPKFAEMVKCSSPQTRIILMSGRPDVELHRGALNLAGAIRKPFNFDTLAEVLSQQIAESTIDVEPISKILNVSPSHLRLQAAELHAQYMNALESFKTEPDAQMRRQLLSDLQTIARELRELMRKLIPFGRK